MVIGISLRIVGFLILIVIYINNWRKNGKARYILDDELEDLANFLSIVLDNIIEREGVLKSDYRRVYTKLEDIVEDEGIYKTLRGFSECGSFIVHDESKISKYDDKFDKNIDLNVNHSCKGHEEEYIGASNLCVYNIKEIYPNEHYLNPPNLIYEP